MYTCSPRDVQLLRKEIEGKIYIEIFAPEDDVITKKASPFPYQVIPLTSILTLEEEVEKQNAL